MNRISLLHLIVSLAGFLGIMQFACVVMVAIHRYPASGIRHGYSISKNFLSDLGCSRTPMGEDNSASATVFNPSAVILGVSLLPFFWVLSTTIYQLRRTVWFSGTLSALGLIGIGLTPYDKHFAAHMVALGFWIGPLFILLIAHFIASVLQGSNSLVRTLLTFLLLAAILAYALAGSYNGYVVMQKLTVAVAVIWFCLIGSNVATTMVRVISDRRRLIEREAEAYMKILQHNQQPLSRKRDAIDRRNN
jgi:hypothetical membrane protein